MSEPVRHRDTVNGRFETAAQAAVDPAESVTESLHDADLAKAVRDLLVALNSSNDLALLSRESYTAVQHLTAVLG